MKALYSEQYYRENWNQLLKPVPGVHYFNLEQDLADEMKFYEDLGVTGEALDKIRSMRASTIADSCRNQVKADLATLKRIESGEASFGYTTQWQETEARHDFRVRFDFNCLQLADFRKKYKLQ